MYIMLKNFTAKDKGRVLYLFMFLFLLSTGLWAQQDRTGYYQKLTGNILQQLKFMQDENAKLAENVKELTKKVRYLEEANKQLSASTLSQQQNSVAIKESARSQHKFLEKKIERMEKKLARMENLIREMGKLSSPQEYSKKTRRRIRPENAVPSGKSEYVEHTVEKGHVLFNIARAYRVSVQEISRINHLKSDKLYIGQKLLIPVKKERSK